MKPPGAASTGQLMDAVTPVLRPPLAAPRRLLKLRSDAALAERFAAGDEAAFAVLYERHRASVLAVCMGVLGATHDAEDAAQDSFASLAVSLRQSPPRELRAWLTRVARNAAIDVARRRRSAVTIDGELPELVARPAGGGPELEAVLAGIRELPENQRTALLMRELAGHSYSEIAVLLETDEHAVRGLIARARVGLRTHREASELPCTAAREALAAHPELRPDDPAVRRHVRTCASCKAYKRGMRDDARALRAIFPFQAGGVASGSALAGGLVAKGALMGGALTQVTAACAASVCAVGGFALLYPQHVARVAPAVLRAHVVAPPSTAAAGVAVHQRPAVARPSVARARVRAAASAPRVIADHPAASAGRSTANLKPSHSSGTTTLFKVPATSAPKAAVPIGGGGGTHEHGGGPTGGGTAPTGSAGGGGTPTGGGTPGGGGTGTAPGTNTTGGTYWNYLYDLYRTYGTYMHNWPMTGTGGTGTPGTGTYPYGIPSGSTGNGGA